MFNSISLLTEQVDKMSTKLNDLADLIIQSRKEQQLLLKKIDELDDIDPEVTALAEKARVAMQAVEKRLADDTSVELPSSGIVSPPVEAHEEPSIPTEEMPIPPVEEVVPDQQNQDLQESQNPSELTIDPPSPE